MNNEEQRQWVLITALKTVAKMRIVVHPSHLSPRTSSQGEADGNNGVWIYIEKWIFMIQGWTTSMLLGSSWTATKSALAMEPSGSREALVFRAHSSWESSAAEYSRVMGSGLLLFCISPFFLLLSYLADVHRYGFPYLFLCLLLPVIFLPFTFTLNESCIPSWHQLPRQPKLTHTAAWLMTEI